MHEHQQVREGLYEVIFTSDVRFFVLQDSMQLIALQVGRQADARAQYDLRTWKNLSGSVS